MATAENMRSPLPLSWESSQGIALQFLAIYLPTLEPYPESFAWLLESAAESSAVRFCLSAATYICEHPTLEGQGTEGYTLYARAIKATRRELGAKRRKRLESIATTYLLSICESFAALASGEPGVLSHIRWLLFMITEAYTTNPGDLGDLGAARFWNYNIRVCAVWHLLTRDESSNDTSNMLQRHLNDNVGLIDDLGTLSSIATTVAHLWHNRQSTKLPSSDNHGGFYALLQVVTQTIEKLYTWIRVYKQSRPGLIPYLSVTGRDMSDSITHDFSIFAHHYEFADLQTAIVHLTFWICQLRLQQTLSSLGLSAFVKDYPNARLDMTDAAAIARCSANDICMSLLYVSRERHGKFGALVMSRPLALVSSYFENVQDYEKLRWCEGLTEELKALGYCI